MPLEITSLPLPDELSSHILSSLDVPSLFAFSRTTRAHRALAFSELLSRDSEAARLWQTTLFRRMLWNPGYSFNLFDNNPLFKGAFLNLYENLKFRTQSNGILLTLMNRVWSNFPIYRAPMLPQDLKGRKRKEERKIKRQETQKQQNQTARFLSIMGLAEEKTFASFKEVFSFSELQDLEKSLVKEPFTLERFFRETLSSSGSRPLTEQDMSRYLMMLSGTWLMLELQLNPFQSPEIDVSQSIVEACKALENFAKVLSPEQALVLTSKVLSHLNATSDNRLRLSACRFLIAAATNVSSKEQILAIVNSVFPCLNPDLYEWHQETCQFLLTFAHYLSAEQLSELVDKVLRIPTQNLELVDAARVYGALDHVARDLSLEQSVSVAEKLVSWIMNPPAKQKAINSFIRETLRKITSRLPLQQFLELVAKVLPHLDDPLERQRLTASQIILLIANRLPLEQVLLLVGKFIENLSGPDMTIRLTACQFLTVMVKHLPVEQVLNIVDELLAYLPQEDKNLSEAAGRLLISLVLAGHFKLEEMPRLLESVLEGLASLLDTAQSQRNVFLDVLRVLGVLHPEMQKPIVERMGELSVLTQHIPEPLQEQTRARMTPEYLISTAAPVPVKVTSLVSRAA